MAGGAGGGGGRTFSGWPRGGRTLGGMVLTDVQRNGFIRDGEKVGKGLWRPVEEEGDYIPQYCYTVTIRTSPVLRWAAMRLSLRAIFSRK